MFGAKNLAVVVSIGAGHFEGLTEDQMARWVMHRSAHEMFAARRREIGIWVKM